MAGESMEEVVRVMSSVGFDLEMRMKKVTALSGGWKMKVPHPYPRSKILIHLECRKESDCPF